MSVALAYLLQKIESEPEKKLTSEELKVFLSIKANCFRGLAFGAVTGSAVAWTVPLPWKIRYMHRFGLAVGVGVVGGLLGFKWSLDSSMDLILELDGSRIQHELATIIMNKFPDDVKRINRISQHFYQERVYDDTTSDKPRYRWRHRNYCVDNNAKSESRDSDNESDSSSDDHTKSDNKKADALSKQVPINRGYNPITNPFDCIFGGSEEDSYHYPLDDTNVKPKIVTRRSKRSQRRKRRLHRHELSQTINA